jgi:DNA-binding CsgD family transcriptional regulator
VGWTWGAAGLDKAVGALGEQDFGTHLLAFLYRACGAEHCTVLHLSADHLSKIATASLDGTDTAQRQVELYLQDHRWRGDPMIAEARQQLVSQPASMIRAEICEFSDVDFRELLYGRAGICERLLLCGRSEHGIIGLSVLRSAQVGAFSSDDVARLRDSASLLLALLGKHIGLSWKRPDLSLALTSLAEIATCIAAAPVAMSRREAEVCARILYGMSSIGIALELGISEETVMTYRKRAYQRLGFASQRELLLWYIDLWNNVNVRGRGRVH